MLQDMDPYIFHECKLDYWDIQNWLYTLVDNLEVIQCSFVNMNMRVNRWCHDIVHLAHMETVHRGSIGRLGLERVL